MTLYQKIMAAYGLLTSSIAGKMAEASVARPFSASETYTKLDVVTHDNVLYRCTKDSRTGPWSDDDFDQTTVEEVILATVEDAKDRILEEVLEKADVAVTFDADTPYWVGDLVFYDGALYRCIRDHEAGAFDENAFAVTTLAYELFLKADLDELATEFSTDDTYAVGDLVTRDGRLYMCIHTHKEAAWSDTDFEEKSVMDALALKTSLTDVEDTIERYPRGSLSTVQVPLDDTFNVTGLTNGSVRTIVLTGDGSSGESSIDIHLPATAQDTLGNFTAMRFDVVIDATNINNSTYIPTVTHSGNNTKIYAAGEECYDELSIHVLRHEFVGRHDGYDYWSVLHLKFVEPN